jgi:hypothetical protein
VRKTKETARTKEVLFDPVLFAATVPSRKPTAKDKADAKERSDDAIEPKEHAKMEGIATYKKRPSLHDLAKDFCGSVRGPGDFSTRSLTGYGRD